MKVAYASVLFEMKYGGHECMGWAGGVVFYYANIVYVNISWGGDEPLLIQSLGGHDWLWKCRLVTGGCVLEKCVVCRLLREFNLHIPSVKSFHVSATMLLSLGDNVCKMVVWSTIRSDHGYDAVDSSIPRDSFSQQLFYCFTESMPVCSLTWVTFKKNSEIRITYD